jgi:hypothetical protein
MKIKQVSRRELLEIIESRKPLGLFYAYDGTVDKFVSVDNVCGEAWTEEFKTATQAEEWLENEERVVTPAIPEMDPLKLNEAMTMAFFCMCDKVQVTVTDIYDCTEKQSYINSIYGDNTVTLSDCVHSDYHVSALTFPTSMTELIEQLKAE